MELRSVTINETEKMNQILERRNQRLKSRNRTLRRLVLALSVFCVMLTTVTVISVKTMVKANQESQTLEERYNELQAIFEAQTDEIKLMKSQYIDLYDENTEVLEENEYLATSVLSLTDAMYAMEEQNVQLLDQSMIYKEAVEEYQEREELYDKYSYAIIRNDGSRTDITFDQLRTAEDMMTENGLDPDLLLSIVMVESNGKEKAKSSISTARGYGQFLKATGKFVYENLMKAGTYDHSYALNGDTNIQMMAEYLNYIIDNSNSLKSAIKWYRGEGGQVLTNYISRIDSYLAVNGKSVDKLK